MSTVLTFSLPEDVRSDKVSLLRSTQRDGSYSFVEAKDYKYGQTNVEFTLDRTSWYKIQFLNLEGGTSSPLSEPVYGGNIDHSAPFVAISTTTDGANYATISDVYSFSGLTPEDISQERVSNALRSARAIIDWRTAEMDFERLDIWDNEIRRRKYNAALRILKEAEINLALANIYQNIADDVIIKNRRMGDDIASGGTAIGGASVGGDNLSERSENIQFLTQVSDRYMAAAERLLSTIDANSVRIAGSDMLNRVPKFVHPFSSRRGNYRYVRW